MNLASFQLTELHSLSQPGFSQHISTRPMTAVGSWLCENSGARATRRNIFRSDCISESQIILHTQVRCLLCFLHFADV
jgi:hypothetical protein